MRRPFLYAALVALAASAAGAGPPRVTLPAEVRGEPGEFVAIKADTDGKAVRFVPMDPGLSVFPAALLSDPRTTVVVGKAGNYRLLAYSGNEDGPSDPAVTVVRIGPAAAPTPAPADPKDPPPVAAGGLYFLLVRPDGPADPAFTAAYELAAWDELRAAGHKVKDKTVPEAAALGVTLPAGTVLPCVVTLRAADGRSQVLRGPVPMPATAAAVLKLAEAPK